MKSLLNGLGHGFLFWNIGLNRIKYKKEKEKEKEKRNDTKTHMTYIEGFDYINDLEKILFLTVL